MNGLDQKALFLDICQEAAKAHAEYPQYKNHYEPSKWKLMQVISLKGLRPRARRSWNIGDITIGRIRDFGEGAELVLYNRKDPGDCIVPDGMAVEI